MTSHTATTRITGTAAPGTTGTAGQVTVRRAGADTAALVRTMVLELATHEDSAHAVHASVEDWERMLANPAVVVLIAYLDDQPVGYVSDIHQLNLWVGDDIFAMDDLYVRAKARDRGIGGRLMAALAEHAAEGNLLVTWGVRENNDAGHRFYRRIGATLRTKVVASWQAHAYRAYLDARP